MCRLVVFRYAVFVTIFIVNRFPDKQKNKILRLYFGFSRPLCLSIYRPPFFSKSFSLLLLFEHNCWHFQLGKVWHSEVLNFSATGNLQFFLTFLVITYDLLIRFWSLVFFSAGCSHSPCEWTSQERQNKFILLSHALSIACGSSDVQAIQKPGIFFLLL